MKKKKLLSVLVAAALGCSLFAAVPVDSQAAEYTSGDWTYTMDGGCTITGYNGSDTNVVIPSEFDGVPVLAIGQSAFTGNTNITSVVIPDTVQTIGNTTQYLGSSSFTGCSNLSNVDLGNSVTTLGYRCFADCDSLTSISLPASMTASNSRASSPFMDCDALKTVTIASGGDRIPGGLFSGCSVLQNVNIPEGIIEIGGNAFDGCVSLKEIKIPRSLQTVGSWGFNGCVSLKEITLPENIRKIGEAAFRGCSSLKDFYDYGMETFYEYYGFYALFGDTTFLTIHGFEGSNAQEFANDYNITFVPLTEKQMYRLYNKNSGEHFYTNGYEEKNNLVSLGWAYEGTAWIAPGSSNTPVYRVYNPNSGEHHYTKDANEKSTLVSLGWNDEGIGWYSDDAQGTPLYRLYNPNATGAQEAGGHHYTKDVNEKNSLIASGWRDEGIGWYGK